METLLQVDLTNERRYSVMQSDGNSLCEDVVLESLNMVNSDEDSI